MSTTTKPNGMFAEFTAPDMEKWREMVGEQLKGVPYEKKLVIKTPEGIGVQPIYNRSDTTELNLPHSIPGKSPFLRGTKALGYKQEAWQVAQELPYADPAAFNAAAKADLERGQDALILRVGAGGLNIQSVADLKSALDGIDLESVPLYLKAGSRTPEMINLLTSLESMPRKGGLGFDPLGDLARDGYLTQNLSTIYDEMAELCKASTLGVRAIDIDVTAYGNAGASAVLQLAAATATAATYFKELLARDVSATDIANNIRIVLPIGGDFFMEIAKFRAVRALWANLLQALETSAAPLIFGAGSSFNKTIYDPYVNLLRSTTEGFAGALGGCDGMSTAPFDVTLGLPNAFSRRISRNTQLVLRDEAHLTEVVDPAGGSWYIESLTQELCEKSWALFQEFENDGGMPEVLAAGKIQVLSEECAEMQRKMLSQRRAVLVGTNMYANGGETLPEVERAPTVEQAIPANASLTVRPLEPKRLAEPYEALRNQTAEKPVKAFMANMGPIKQHKIRCDFATEFLRPAGIDVLADKHFDDAATAARAAVESGATITVICSTDDTYPELVPAFAQAVKAAKPELTVLMAGLLPDYSEAFKEAGVDDFIHMRANNLALLQTLIQGEGA